MARKRPSSVNKDTSRYSQGGVTYTFPKRVGWWEREIFALRDDDVNITITNRQAGRPDLIAYDMYQDSSLMWLVMQYNNIVDPVEELAEGLSIRVPARQRVLLSILTKSTGGTPEQQ